MSQEILDAIQGGLGELHKKHDSTTAEYKAMHEAIKADVKSYAEQAQKLELELKGKAERLSVIEESLAKSGSNSKAQAEDVMGLLTKGTLLNLKNKGQLVTGGELVTKAQTASQGSLGGVLINEAQVDQMIISYLKDTSPMLRYANVVTLPRGTSSIKMAKRTLEYGAKFAGELQTGGKTLNKYEAVFVHLNRIFSSIQDTEEFMHGQLLVNQNRLIESLFEDIGYQINDNCLFGDGLSKPAGLLKEKFLLETAYASAGQLTPTPAPSKVTLADLVNMQRAFKYQKYRENGSYFMSYDTWADLYTEKGADNHFVDLANSRLGGADVVIFNAMDKLLSPTTMPVLFGDMKKAYTIVVTGEYQTKVDDITEMSEGLITLGASTMAGGHVIDEEAIRAIKGA